MDVKIWTIPSAKIAYVEHVGPYPDVYLAWEKLCAWAGPNNVFSSTSKFYGFYYDDPAEVAPENLRSEASLTVPDEVEVSGEVKLRDFPGGKYAVMVHLGPYTGLHESWTKFYKKWLPESGFEHLEAPCVEQYMNDPQTTDPEHLVTLLLMPVK